MEYPIFQVDAFTAEPFKGNPAAVCLLDGPRPAGWMQQVGAEMNLSETAFLWPHKDGFELRWFTPEIEVPLCGHATLASAHVLFETGRAAPGRPVRFHTRSGLLVARRAGPGIELDFPAIPVVASDLPDAARAALGVSPRYVARTPGQPLRGGNYLVELADEEAVRGAHPDFAAMRRAVPAGVILTARAEGGGYDFVSRYFAPDAGIDEDPVTGSAHCVIAPWLAARTGRAEFVGEQASARGGTVGMRLEGDRVVLSGRAVTVLEGVLRDDPPAA
jgi:PhzF family phenazine biosynthesis protein